MCPFRTFFDASDVNDSRSIFKEEIRIKQNFFKYFRIKDVDSSMSNTIPYSEDKVKHMLDIYSEIYNYFRDKHDFSFLKKNNFRAAIYKFLFNFISVKITYLEMILEDTLTLSLSDWNKILTWDCIEIINKEYNLSDEN